MNEYGEFLIISGCIEYPYKKSDILSFIELMVGLKASFTNIIYLDVSPEAASFEHVFEGVDTFSKNELDLNDLNINVISSLNISFGGVLSKLIVMFVDNASYTVSLLFNYTDVINDGFIKSVNNITFIESIGIKFFEKINPAVGTLALENSVSGITFLINEESDFPTERAYYNKQLYKENKQRLEGLLSQAKFINNFENGGIYFRKSEISEFNTHVSIVGSDNLNLEIKFPS